MPNIPVHAPSTLSQTTKGKLVGALSAARGLADASKKQLKAGMGSFLDAVFEVVTLDSTAQQVTENLDTRDLFEMSVEEATKQLQYEQQRYDEEWRQRSKQSYGE